MSDYAKGVHAVAVSFALAAVVSIILWIATGDENWATSATRLALYSIGLKAWSLFV